MKPINRASATTAARMAFSTKAAGPSLRNDSKTDSIVDSKCCVGAPLRALLISSIGGDILARRESKAEPAAIGVRGKAAELIHAREVLRPRRKKRVPREPALAEARQRETEARCAGRPPFRRSRRETAARARQSDRPGKFMRKIDEGRAGHRQNARGRIPEPVRAAARFQSPEKARFREPPTAAVLEKRFAARNDSLVASHGAPDGERAPVRGTAGDTGRGLVREKARALVERCGKIRAPARRPARGQAGRLRVIGIREVEPIRIGADAQLVMRLWTQRREPVARFTVRRVEIHRGGEIGVRFRAAIERAQDAAPREE